MLGITVILLGRTQVTARELADRFEVSIRTIYRDIEAIQQAGIPVVCLQGKGGGYSLMDNYKIDRRLLTFDDMMAILTALRGATTMLSDPGMESAMDKIISLVPRDRAAETERHFERLIIDYLPWGFGQKNQEKMQRVHRAIMENRLIEITYRNLRGETGARLIEPMTLFFKGYSWYLFAYCRLKEDYRVFRLSRIVQLGETDRDFVRREVSFRSYQDDDSPGHPPVRLVMKFDPEVRLRVEEQFDTEELTLNDDGSLLAIVHWPEDEWVHSTLLSYGEHVEVLEPLHIRRLLCERAQKIMSRHQT